MAQFDTGLGWSANQGWLLNRAPQLMGTIGDFGGPAFPGQPLPKNCTNAEEVYAAGYLGQSRPSSNYALERYYGVQGSADVVLCRYNLTETVVQLAAITTVPGTVVNMAQRRTDTGALLLLSPVTCNSTVTYGGTTFYIGYPSTTTDTTYYRVPYFATRNDALAAIQIAGQDFYKFSMGYSVSCIAIWNNTEGNTVASPILISNDREYIKLSLDGTTEATATVVGMRWQNMMFYMAIMPGYSGAVDSPLVNTADLTAAFPGGIGVGAVFEAIARTANIRVIATTDPYNDQGDPSEPGGGEGNPDDDEEIDFSTPPTVGSYVGFFRMWNPTETELRQLASWMWSSAFDLDTFKRIFSAPIDAILGLSLVPVQPAGIGGFTIVLGGIDTGISAFTVTNRYVTLSCGSLTVDERWGAYLDYAPYTKMSIFLPYIGFRDISTDDVMGKTVALQYSVDVLSGACVAELKCGGSVLYSWQGNCAQQLPITSADWSNALSAALGLAGTAATAIVTGGGSLPLAGTVASATVNALSLKPRMERGGSISGAAGAMAGQVPYLVRERPEQAVPGRQNHFIGYPSFTTVTLGSIAGYTEVESIHLEGIPATAAELSELESILKEGFIL